MTPRQKQTISRIRKARGPRTGPYVPSTPKPAEGTAFKRFEFGATPQPSGPTPAQKRRHRRIRREAERNVLEHGTLGSREGNRAGKEKILTDYIPGAAPGTVRPGVKSVQEIAAKIRFEKERRERRKRQRERSARHRRDEGWGGGHSYAPGDSSLA